MRLLALLLLSASLVAQRGPATNGEMPSQIRSSPPRVPIPPGPGRIVGRLLDRERLTPIPDAAITVEYLGPGTGRGGYRPPVASRTVTLDGAGGFDASDLALGDYAVVAAADGYTPARRIGTTIDQGEPVTLSANRPDATVIIRHSRVGSISGLVRDASGAAIPPTAVRILHHVVNGGALVWQPMPVVTITDVAGRYGFTNVPPGDYVVGVLYKSVSIPATVFDAFWTPPSAAAGARLRERLMDSNSVTPPAPPFAGSASTVGGLRWFVHDAIDRPMRPTEFLTDDGRRMTTFIGGADSVATAAVIALEAGEARTDANITVRTGRGVRVSGVLAGEPDQVAHVGLYLFRPAEDDVMQTFGGEVASTITDGTGRFTFLDVPQGPALLETVLTSAAYGAPGMPAGVPRRTPILFGRARLDVGAAGIGDLEVPLRPLMTIRGRFEFEGNSVDRPAPTLVALSSASARGANVRPRAIGPMEFAFDGLLPGRYLLYMSGFRDWRVKAMTARGTDAIGRAVELDDGDVNDVVITFAIGHNRVTGVVRGADGAVVDSAQVVVFPVDFRSWAANGRSAMTSRSLRTDAGGRFSIPTIPDGEYFVAAFEVDMWRDWERLSALEAISKVATRFRVAGAQDLTVDVRIGRDRAGAAPGRSTSRSPSTPRQRPGRPS